MTTPVFSAPKVGTTLVLRDLRFGYSRRKEVLRGVTVAFTPGRTVLLGPNGAGKSTLLRLACGLAAPRAGSVALGGEVSQRQLRRQVGYLPQRVDPMPGLTVLEAVRFVAWLSGLSAREALTSARTAVDTVGLGDKAGERSTRLSGGQLRRMGLASVLAGKPRVLLLDEPTAGLDPAQRLRFREVLASLPSDLPVVVSTHDLGDVEETFDRVGVLADGRLRWEGTPAELLGMDAQRRGERAYLQLIGEE